jgi:hypothetical protein
MRLNRNSRKKTHYRRRVGFIDAPPRFVAAAFATGRLVSILNRRFAGRQCE